MESFSEKSIFRYGVFICLFSFFIFSCDDDDSEEIVNGPDCNWEFLLEDSMGIASHLSVSSAYWVYGNPYNLHGDEVWYHLTEAHGHPDHIDNIEGTDVKWILDIETYLFDYANHNLFPDIDERIDYLATQISGKEQNISYLYLADEPYLNGKEITITMLETAIDKIKTKFPGLLTYITFTHNYFLTTDIPAAGTQPGSNRGIPANLDVISFDWYSNGTDGDSKRNIEELVKPTVEEIKKLTSIPILLTGEAFEDTHDDTTLAEPIFRYWDYANSENQIIGVDHFTWADNPNFLGLTSLTKSQSVVKAISKEIRTIRQEMPTDAKIPVYEYVDTHDAVNNRMEYKYDAWFWNGWTTSCYDIKEVKFYLPAPGKEGTMDLYMAIIDKSSETNRGYPFYDHQLTTDPLADGQNLARASQVIGAIFTAQEDGTIPLYEFESNVVGMDRAYSTEIDEYEGVNSYSISNGGIPIGYVFPVF